MIPGGDWTTNSDIIQLLNLLLREVRGVLGGELVGFYLHGSLAGGEFKPGRSDIDFLVVSQGEIPADLFL